MRFVFLHHEPLGPIDLPQLWDGTQMFGGSVARLRFLFWLAARGHDVSLVGNVKAGTFNGVRAIPGVQCLSGEFGRSAPNDFLVLNNPPPEREWEDLFPQVAFRIILWAGNPFSPVWLERVRRGSIARIVCVSQYHRELYRIYAGFDAVEASYSGIDLDLLCKAPPRPEAQGAVVFCSVPRRTKGFHNLLSAWRRVRAVRPSARLRVCGAARMHDPDAEVGPTGILDRDIEDAFPDFFGCPGALERAGITLLGRCTLLEVYGEMKAAAVAIANCNWRGSFETFCRSAVEIQAAGTAVVGAARGSLPEVVVDGGTGLLVQREDPALLADAIEAILQEPRRWTRGVDDDRLLQLADYHAITAQWEGIAARAITGEKSPRDARWRGDLLRLSGYGHIRFRTRQLLRGGTAERWLLRYVR